MSNHEASIATSTCSPMILAGRALRDVRHPAIGAYEYAILNAIIWRMDARGFAWPRYSTIAADAKCSVKVVELVVPYLRTIGVIKADDDEGKAVYRIDVERLATLPDDVEPRTDGRRKGSPMGCGANPTGAGADPTQKGIPVDRGTLPHGAGTPMGCGDHHTPKGSTTLRGRGEVIQGRDTQKKYTEGPERARAISENVSEPCPPTSPSSRESPSQPSELAAPPQAPSSAPKAQDGQLAAQQGASTGLPRRPPDPKRAWHGQPDHEEVNDSKQLPKKTAGSEIVTDTVPASPDELAAILRSYPMLAAVAKDRRRVENLHSTVMNKALLVRHVRQACEDLCAKRAGSAVGWDVGRLADEIGLFLSNAKQRATKVGVTSEETAALIEIFDELWSKHHGGKPRGCDSGDDEHAGKLVELARKGTAKCGVPPRDVARYVIRQYLNDHDRFLEDNLHPLRLLPGRASSYELPRPQAEKKAGVVPARPPTEAELEASKQAARECFRVVMGGKV